MNRVADNQLILKQVTQALQSTECNEEQVSRVTATTILGDISISLAVIADKLTELKDTIATNKTSEKAWDDEDD